MKVLEAYADRNITRGRAAALLRISERQITRYMVELGLEREVSETAKAQDDIDKRRLIKERAAQAVIAGQLSYEAAAARAGCHARTMRRYVARLRKKKR